MQLSLKEINKEIETSYRLDLLETAKAWESVRNKMVIRKMGKLDPPEPTEGKAE